MTEEVDYYLDITRHVCPMTFVHVKLLIERMRPGEVCEVRLKGAEPLLNVPRSVRDLGHAILSLAPEAGEGNLGVHCLRIRKT